MLSASDRYIYLTRNHYVQSGQAKKDITYINRMYNQNRYKKKKDKSKELTNAIHHLFDNFKGLNSTTESKKGSMTFADVASANKKINEIENNSQRIIEYCGVNGYINQQADTIEKKILSIDLINIEEQVKDIKKNLQQIAATLKRVFITGNVNINKAIAKFENNITNFYNKSNTNILISLRNINVAAAQDLSELMNTLYSCYSYIMQDYAIQMGIVDARKEMQKVLKTMNFKNYKPANLTKPTLQVKVNRFNPKVSISNKQATISYNSLELKINRIIKPIVKNFNIIVGKELFLSDVKDDAFLYHFANLAQYQIGGGPKRNQPGYNSPLEPLGLDIAKQAAQVMAVKRYLNENNLKDYYYNNNVIKSVNEIYNNAKLTLSHNMPWYAPITTYDRRYFSRKTLTPEKRVRNILSNLHQQKLRIAIK